MIVTYNGRAAEFEPHTLHFHPLDGIPDNAVEPAATTATQPAPLPPGPTILKRGPRLQRLVMNVANFCNLDCVYCYAQGGDYGGPHEKMTIDIGQKAFTKFFNLYEEIATIQFFGGEPLLNWPVIDQLCEYGWQLADKLGPPRPMYTVITNGTVIRPEVVDMIRRYDMKITVSLDGPPAINDRLRIARSHDSGSLTGQIADNIRWLKSETGQPGQIEGTFTRLHVQEGCSVSDVLDFIAQELGVGQLHMPVNVLGESATRDPYALRGEDFDWAQRSYADAVAKTIHSLISQPVHKQCILRFALDIIEPLLRSTVPEPHFLCPAGHATIAVDSNGEVYPCFMFYRMAQFHMGSVRTPGNNPLRDDAQMAFLSAIQPGAIPVASASWAQGFFSGCAGSNYFRNGHHGRVSNQEIALIETMVSAAVVELAHLSTNTDLWQYLPHALTLFKMYHTVPDE